MKTRPKHLIKKEIEGLTCYFDNEDNEITSLEFFFYNKAIDDMDAWLEDKVVIRRSELSEEIIETIIFEEYADGTISFRNIAQAILSHIEAKAEK